MTNDNAQALLAAFAAAEEGNPVPLVELYSDDMTWAGFTLDGTLRLYTKAEFLEAFGVLAKLDESRNEVTDTEVVGDDLVVAKIRAYRRLGDLELDTVMVMTHRFTDGKVTRGTDMCSATFEEFWAKTGLSI
ncbi:nuclear transport factor 2 family protein [Rhodococcus sp. NPDC003318]|uniref:nuclear transport factor 2 family protein n=1 Tax=Rhodococcus sp. NPDC003318 TaxID=3364503 RepID=UPI0036B6F657